MGTKGVPVPRGLLSSQRGLSTENGVLSIWVCTYVEHSLVLQGVNPSCERLVGHLVSVLQILRVPKPCSFQLPTAGPTNPSLALWEGCVCGGVSGACAIT